MQNAESGREDQIDHFLLIENYSNLCVDLVRFQLSGFFKKLLIPMM